MIREAVMSCFHRGGDRVAEDMTLLTPVETGRGSPGRINIFLLWPYPLPAPALSQVPELTAPTLDLAQRIPTCPGHAAQER